MTKKCCFKFSLDKKNYKYKLKKDLYYLLLSVVVKSNQNKPTKLEVIFITKTFFVSVYILRFPVHGEIFVNLQRR